MWQKELWSMYNRVYGDRDELDTARTHTKSSLLEGLRMFDYRHEWLCGVVTLTELQPPFPWNRAKMFLIS